MKRRILYSSFLDKSSLIFYYRTLSGKHDVSFPSGLSSLSNLSVDSECVHLFSLSSDDSGTDNLKNSVVVLLLGIPIRQKCFRTQTSWKNSTVRTQDGCSGILFLKKTFSKKWTSNMRSKIEDWRWYAVNCFFAKEKISKLECSLDGCAVKRQPYLFFCSTFFSQWSSLGNGFPKNHSRMVRMWWQAQDRDTGRRNTRHFASWPQSCFLPLTLFSLSLWLFVLIIDIEFRKTNSYVRGGSSLQKHWSMLRVCDYVYMQKLDLSNCGLHALPDDICHLSLLEVL